MVMGNISAPHLSKDDGVSVYGLKSEERATLVRVILSKLIINNEGNGRLSIILYVIIFYQSTYKRT